MPPEREAFLFVVCSLWFVVWDLIKEGWLVIFHLLEYSPHERFADEAAFVGHAVFLAEPIQCAQFALVEQD